MAVWFFSLLVDITPAPLLLCPSPHRPLLQACASVYFYTGYDCDLDDIYLTGNVDDDDLYDTLRRFSDQLDAVGDYGIPRCLGFNPSLGDAARSQSP